MKIINPKIEVEKYDGVKIMKNIERAMRVCYRSEGLATEDSYKRLLKMAVSKTIYGILADNLVVVKCVQIDEICLCVDSIHKW